MRALTSLPARLRCRTLPAIPSGPGGPWVPRRAPCRRASGAGDRGTRQYERSVAIGPKRMVHAASTMSMLRGRLAMEERRSALCGRFSLREFVLRLGRPTSERCESLTPPFSRSSSSIEPHAGTGGSGLSYRLPDGYEEPRRTLGASEVPPSLSLASAFARKFLPEDRPRLLARRGSGVSCEREESTSEDCERFLRRSRSSSLVA
mmetsp:Transcript_29670/g.81042  ORF Transcript_29670/g.81042 Transcript_29670/m.81042 type:complete len:205 (+) Transcript_29670:2231-2845(+)